MYCNNCGKKNEDHSNFCEFCGSKLELPETLKEIAYIESTQELKAEFETNEYQEEINNVIIGEDQFETSPEDTFVQKDYNKNPNEIFEPSQHKKPPKKGFAVPILITLCVIILGLGALLIVLLSGKVSLFGVQPEPHQETNSNSVYVTEENSAWTQSEIPSELKQYEEGLVYDGRTYTVTLDNKNDYINYRSSPEYIDVEKDDNNILGKLKNGTAVYVEYIYNETWAVFYIDGVYVFASLYSKNDASLDRLMVATDNRDTKIPFDTSASSELKESGKIFGADNLHDYDPNTCWAEGVDGIGIGENVTLTFEENTEIQEIGVLGGYCKGEDLYYANARPKLLKIKLVGENDSMTFEIGADDSFGTYMKYRTNMYHNPVKQIVITIVDVYEGSKYNDTCISEIYVR